jgi:hypothetical protein
MFPENYLRLSRRSQVNDLQYFGRYWQHLADQINEFNGRLCGNSLVEIDDIKRLQKSNLRRPANISTPPPLHTYVATRQTKFYR